MVGVQLWALAPTLTSIPSNLEAHKSPWHAGLYHLLWPSHPLWTELPLICFPRREMKACTFEEEVGFGQVQLVPKGDTGVLHPCAGLKLHTHLELEGPGQHTRLSFPS